MTTLTASDLAPPIQVRSGSAVLEGELSIPAGAQGIVLFAHGSGSSHHSPRNQFVARAIQTAGIGTLLFDLLTREEEAAEAYTRHLRFDIQLLARRLIDASHALQENRDAAHLRVGYFGASTGGGAALVAAAELGERIGAVVLRGGRPDLAEQALPRVKSPTLLIVGGLDEQVIELNQFVLSRLTCPKELRIVPGATHLFEGPGTLEEVARLAAAWFRAYWCRDGRIV